MRSFMAEGECSDKTMADYNEYCSEADLTIS
jgi:hypothetical protein